MKTNNNNNLGLSKLPDSGEMIENSLISEIPVLNNMTIMAEELRDVYNN